MDKIKLILGTMTFGPQVEIESARTMVCRFRQSGYHEVDTAYVYNEGKAEIILGSILGGITEGSLYIATKVHPRITGRLNEAAITMQLNESLRRLGRNSVDLLYLHMPDSGTPIEVTLEACANLHEQGKFREMGLSNFPVQMVVDICHLCEKHGWPRPIAYQGLYNGLSRNVEKELFPALRKLGMYFYAYNPLAGGMLTGKHVNYTDNPVPGRFTLRRSYLNRYWKKAYFEAVSVLAKTCQDTGIALAEAALRWLTYHSYLDKSRGDGIIIGASNIVQLEQNLSAVEKGVLPETVVRAFDVAWGKTKSESPGYFRCYPGSIV